MVELSKEADLSKRKLVSITAGNYGKAFAYYLQKAGLSGTCVMPLTVPDNRVKMLKVRMYMCVYLDNIAFSISKKQGREALSNISRVIF